MKRTFLLLFLSLTIFSSFAQEEITDTSSLLEGVIVKAFEQNRKASNSTFAVTFIVNNNADRYNKSSLVNGFNSIAGVRMEERSPGSYRINIRGSSLRSPFGVRNVKVYWNDIPITDPGGNTYFNQFAYNNFSSIEIFKGPAGSLYGAGTGGLILLNNFNSWQPGVNLEYITGSYNLQNAFITAKFGQKENKNQLTYAHNQSNGYRIQSRMRRDNFSWQSQLKLSEKQQITAAVLFTDMYYQTPGALTLAEYTANPKNARPAAGGFPSSVDAKAAIWQKNLIVGLSSHYQLATDFKNTTTFYGAFNQVKNSAVRNYERRNEPGFGGRTVFTLNKKSGANNWQFVAGSEFQQGDFNTQVAKNKNGNPDTLQTNDDINYTVYNVFVQSDFSITDSWILNGGISLNKTSVLFSRLSSYPVVKQIRKYQNELAPRFAVLKKINDNFSLKGTISRGFSPPTVAELLPSTGVISTELEAEYGWNYEFAATKYLLKRKLQIEVTGFYFKLKNALVQRRDLSGADYFVNAGDVQEKGIEAHTDYFYNASARSLLNYLTLRADYTYNHFRYGSFVKGNNDFSGKTVPSVPTHTLSVLADINLKNGIYTNITWYTASKIFLNDANTAAADGYNLAGCRIGFKKIKTNKFKINLYAGVDNLLDKIYSLGNDINAAANRFYNAAPRRNYYAGISLDWLKSNK